MSRIFSEVKSARLIMREKGVRALFSRYGWKLVAVIFCYYLIRDLSIYVLLPIMLTRMF